MFEVYQAIFSPPCLYSICMYICEESWELAVLKVQTILWLVMHEYNII